MVPERGSVLDVLGFGDMEGLPPGVCPGLESRRRVAV